jgi:fluoride ion exporter CrcB/FEX
MQHGAVGVAGAYIVASVLGGVLAAALGYALLAR